MPAPLQSVPVDTPLSPHDPQAAPYSPSLINLNNRYNMSASSLTEALLLLSGMYISLVQPEPGPIRVGLHAVFPRTTASFRSAIIDPFSERNKFRTFFNYGALPTVFDIATSYTRSEYAPKELLDMLCEDVFPKNTITIFYLNNHLGLRQYTPPAVRYLPRILESLGLPIISYDTQFSPNSRPALSIQLAPTMGQMMDVIFAFLKRFHWSDFSFLCTLSYGCLDEVTSIRAKVDEFQQRSKFNVYGVESYAYKLLSYVNFTDGTDRAEVTEKLKYELHKDSRINLVHGNGAEVKTIMDIAKELGLTGHEYVWIFTAASITVSQEGTLVDESYPLGSFIIGFDSSRENMENVVKTGVNLWLQALNSLVTSPDFDNIDFKTGFSCDRLKDNVAQKANNSGRLPLFWKHGEMLYKYILNSHLPGGLKFDEYGVLETNRFWILNVQNEDTSSNSGDASDKKSGVQALVSNMAGINGQPNLGSGFLAGRPTSGETDPQNHIKADPIHNDLSQAWNSGQRIHVSKNKDSSSQFPQTGYEDSTSQFSLSRRSARSTLQPHHQQPPVRQSASHQPTYAFPDPSLGSIKISNAPNNSRLPAINDKSHASIFPRKHRTSSIFSQGGQSRISTKKAYESSFLSSTDSTYLPRKNKRSLSTSIYKTSGYVYDGSTGSSPLSAYNATTGNTQNKDKTSNTAYLSSANSSTIYNQHNTHTNQIKSSIINSTKRSNSRVSRSSSSEKHSTTRRRPYGSHDHIKTRRRDNSHKITRKRWNCSNRNQTNSQDYTQPGNRSLSYSAENFPDRPRRQIVRRQISKKIADWDGYSLSMAGIVWPGGRSLPPKGKPDKYLLRVVTWREDPHVIYLEKQNNMSDGGGSCDVNSLPCQVYVRNKQLHSISNITKDMCCTGLCIDLLIKLGEMLHFDVQLSEVHEGGYGSPLNKNLTDWNGMLGMVIHNKADMAIGALSITPERSVAVDFSVPFLQTGIAIIVAIREGVISPTAFLEPYDYPSWSLILVFSVHATGASIFIFEWLSPYGLNQGKTSMSVHKFSLFRSFWLIWAMLFGASVSTDQPKGIASRFLANIWALFAVVFCASYTANLAAFMITKDDFYDLSGIQDWRLKNPHHRQPPFKFATIANSSTDLNIAKNYKEIHRYMKTEAQTDVKDAIRNLKQGHIQAFIYDSTTLEYEVGKDDFCKLKTVGKRIAETGYGVAFPRRSQWVQEVNKALLRLQEQGEIERLQKFWLAGACHKKKEPGISSHTLGILNFTSAFILLGSGVILGVVLLILEHAYFRFGRQSLKKWDKNGCCSLVSLSMGKSLTFEQSVMEAIDYHKHHKCKDPLCESQLWKIRYDLDIALLKISQLRKQIAHSASNDASRRRDSVASAESDFDVVLNHNGTARRHRQQSCDRNSTHNDDSFNHPLLAIEGNTQTTDGGISYPSSTRRFVQFTPKSSYTTNKNVVSVRENNIPLHNIHLSHCQKRRSQEFKMAFGDATTDEQSAILTKKLPSFDGTKTGSGHNLHSLASSFGESISGFASSPDELTTISSILPPLSSPPLSFPRTASSSSLSNVHPHHSLIGHERHPPSSNTSNRYSSISNNRFVSTVPGSSSSLSFSDDCKKRLKSPCANTNKNHTKVPSQKTDYPGRAYSSKPEALNLMDECNDYSTVGHTTPTSSSADSHYKHIQTNSNYSISSDNANRHSGEWSNARSEIKKSNLVPSSRRDNASEISGRQVPDRFGNVYVNMTEIIGKETSF